MTVLGHGTRVMVSPWVPGSDKPGVSSWALGRKGTILGGPEDVRPGDVGHHVCIFGREFLAQYVTRYWIVAIDGAKKIVCEEPWLIPLNGGETQNTERERRVTA